MRECEARIGSVLSPGVHRVTDIQSDPSDCRATGLRAIHMENLDYGIIGNGKSCALVSRKASIDWCCLADFDSPSVFAALLDKQRGGRFSVDAVGDECQASQEYIRRTNILRTRFTSAAGDFEVIDFMPRYRTEQGGYHCPPDVIRMLRPLRGTPQLRVVYDPRLGYGECPTRLIQSPRYLKAETVGGPHESVYLYSSFDLTAVQAGAALPLEKPEFLWLAYDQKIGDVDGDRVELELERTKVYWMAWSARTTRPYAYRAEVERSALVLKLLSYQRTGAMLAAATTSLPETIGEPRNWDYRFCWIRDASMTIRTLVNIGHHYVARRFFEFLLDVATTKDDRLQIMYGIRGQKELEERTLDWLEGYEGSRPVRVGNAAWCQQQNDIYGVLLDVLYEGFVLFRDETSSIESLWTMTRGIVRHIDAEWTRPDQGIWEIRGEPRHFTFSKVMCWVGMDRAVRIATMLGMDDYALDWAVLRGRIRSDIMDAGWSREVGAFTQSYGSSELDAANLLFNRLGFLAADDPRWIATVRATHAALCRDGLMYRYKNEDDFGTPSSSFTVCSFWMVQALHSIGETRLARDMFERLLACSNHVGLFSEDIDFRSGRLLGNFPQAYSHLALIDTAFLFNEVPLHADHLLSRPGVLDLRFVDPAHEKPRWR